MHIHEIGTNETLRRSGTDKLEKTMHHNSSGKYQLFASIATSTLQMQKKSFREERQQEAVLVRRSKTAFSIPSIHPQPPLFITLPTIPSLHALLVQFRGDEVLGVRTQAKVS
mgnify:CR=1 FL=1